MIRFFLSPLVFVALGPPVGIFLLGLTSGGRHIFGAVFFAYLFGAIPAAFAGLLHALFMRLLLPYARTAATHWAVGGCVGAVSGYCAMLTGNWFLLHRLSETRSPGLALPSLLGTVPLVWAGVGAGAICGALVSYWCRRMVSRKEAVRD